MNGNKSSALLFHCSVRRLTTLDPGTDIVVDGGQIVF